MRRLGISAALASLTILAPATPAIGAPSSTIRDGPARFEVITPSLMRLEYAADRRFENRRTLTTAGRKKTRPRFRTRVRGRTRVIHTSRLTLRWGRGTGPFEAGSLVVKAGKRKVRPRPGPNPAPLGGWRRSLDLVDGPVPLHEGMLSRAGWYLLDDSETALLRRGGFVARRDREGAYQDLYLFAYGRNYTRGLRDLRTLTGAAPLLPRKAFGVWFSRWWPYSADEWQELVERFRRERVPLDTISIDTDFKRVHDPTAAQVAAAVVGAPGTAYSWNGWDWNRELYPEPRRFLRWARSVGLEVGLNVHPSISSTDPRFAETQERAAGGLEADDGCRVVQADPFGECMVFDWTDADQLDAYFALHEPFEHQGNLFWWLDWCCDGSSAEAPGLTPDTWINKQYADRQRARGSRWPSFGRIGGSHQLGFGSSGGVGAFAEHRYTIQFTGDTCGSWPLLAFAAEFTGAAASIGMPYVSHDIGTFHAVSPAGICDQDLSPLLTPAANELPDEMYVRWVQLGAFQPLDRLHSHHGLRLPWEYPARHGDIATEFLRLRGSLVPYLYTLAREAHDTGVPIVRPMYLRWPGHSAAYSSPTQYTLGRDVLVAPVTGPEDPAETTVWFPPGRWVDWFTGERHRGPAAKSLTVPLERMPVFVRSGSVVPTQPRRPTTPAGPARSLVLIAPSGNGRSTIYDDSGAGFAYERGRFTRTALRQRRARGVSELTVGRARGRFGSQPRRRSYEIRLIGVKRPRAVTIAGRRVSGWRYESVDRTVSIPTGKRSTSRPLRIEVR